MELEYKGGDCIVISHKKDEYVSDPGLSSLGLNNQSKNATVHLLTQKLFEAPASEETVVINGPGEYEVNDCSIKGIAAHLHAYPDGPKQGTIYRLSVDDVSVVVLGHIVAKLEEQQLEEIGMVDVLVIPVGGYGYTLEPKQAVEVVRAIEPKIVIPVHYEDQGVKYDVPQASLDVFLKELGIQAQESISKLKVKSGQLPEKLTVYKLMRSK